MLISSLNHDVNFQRAIASCKVFEHLLYILGIQQEVVHGTTSRSFTRNHNTICHKLQYVLGTIIRNEGKNLL